MIQDPAAKPAADTDEADDAAEPESGAGYGNHAETPEDEK